MMKKSIFLIPLFTVIFTGYVQGEDFLGAPVIPGADILEKTEVRLEAKTVLTHDEVLQYYRESLKDQQDIKFRNWKDATYIEDDGRLPWHSITISKGGRAATSIVIVKDNWTWIMGTLLLRFVGVFVVLMILFLFMSLSGKVLAKFFREPEKGEQTG
jgi:hypothetical protein